MNNLTPEEREVGKENYFSALSTFDQSPAAEHWKRRDFLKTVLGVGAAATAGVDHRLQVFRLFADRRSGARLGDRHRRRRAAC